MKMSSEPSPRRLRRRGRAATGSSSDDSANNDDDDGTPVGAQRLPPPLPHPPHIAHALSAAPAQLTAFSLARTGSPASWALKDEPGDDGAAPASASAAATASSAGKLREAAAALSAIYALLAWSAASAALVFMNKRLLVDAGFKYPFALTGAGQLVSAAAAVAASRSGLWRGMPIGPLPRPFGAAVAALGPSVLCSAATLYFGNAAYLTLSLTFIQMLKVLMPAFTQSAAAAAGLERPTPRLVSSVVLILVGSAAATAAEAGVDVGSLLAFPRRGARAAGSAKGLFLGGGGVSARPYLPLLVPPSRAASGKKAFSWLGFWYFVLSSVFEAGRVVWMQALMNSTKATATTAPAKSEKGAAAAAAEKRTAAAAAAAAVRKYNPAEVLAFLGPPTGLCLLLGACVYEREGLLHSPNGLRAVARRPLPFAAALLMGFAVNATTAAAIGATSSLTFKVFGCAKNAAVVLLGVAAGDSVSAPAALGYGLSMLGFGLYTSAKIDQEKEEKEKEESRREREEAGRGATTKATTGRAAAASAAAFPAAAAVATAATASRRRRAASKAR